MKIIFTLLLIAATFSLTAQTREKAFEINEKLGRGINYGNMFEAPSENEWGNPWKPEYAGVIAGLGFNHVRIPIRWEPAERSSSVPPYNIYSTFLNRIKQVVDSALNNGLYAIINMHHHEALYDDPAGQKDRFLSMWGQISEFFKDYPDSLLFEILNEPHGNLTADKWNELIPEVLDTIRINNPDRIVMIGMPEYGGLGGLPSLEIPDDENIILTVHYYNPFQFTHQGAEWVGGDADTWLGTKWNDTETEREVMRQEFAPLRAVSEQYNIPVHIGEFGAYSKADMTSRAKWTTFLSRYFEKLGWSWAYWEFSAGFGIYNPQNKTFNEELVNALLHNKMPDPARYEGAPIYTSNFQTSNDGWNLSTNNSASAALNRENNSLNISINNAGAEGWHIQLVKNNIALQAGKKYRYSFKAKAGAARSLTTYIGMNSSPWSAYSGYFSATIGDTLAVYTFVFDAAQTDNAARIVFDLGLSDADVTVTDIQLEEVVLVPPSKAGFTERFKTSAYPNPVKDKLIVNNLDEFKKIAILNIRGSVVISGTLQNYTNNINLENLSPGMYFLQLSGQNKTHSIKILKR